MANFGNWVEDYIDRIGSSGLAAEASGTSGIAGAGPKSVSSQSASDEQSSSNEAEEAMVNDGTSPEAKQSNRDKIRNLNKTFSDTSNDEDAANVFHLGDKQNRKMWDEQFAKDIVTGKYSPTKLLDRGTIALEKDYKKAAEKYEQTGDIDDLYAVTQMSGVLLDRKGKKGSSPTNVQLVDDYNRYKFAFNEAERNENYKELIDSNSDKINQIGLATAAINKSMNDFINNPSEETYKAYNEVYKKNQPIRDAMGDELNKAITQYGYGSYYDRNKDKFTINDDLVKRFKNTEDKYKASKKTEPAKTTSETVKEVAASTPKKPADEVMAKDVMSAETEGEEKATKKPKEDVKGSPIKDGLDYVDFWDNPRSDKDNGASGSSAANWSNSGTRMVDNVINKFRSKYGDNIIGNAAALKKLMSPAGVYSMMHDGFEGFKDFAKKLDLGEISDEELAELYDFMMKDENADELFVEANQTFDRNISDSGEAPVEKIENDTAKRLDDSTYNLGLKREDDDEKSKVASDEKVKSFYSTLLKFDPVVRKVCKL